MSDILAIQWRNKNDEGKYPFSVNATLANNDVLIPENLFADARLYPIGGQHDLFMSRIVKSETAVTFYFSDSETTDIASATVELTAPGETIRVLDRWGREAGVLVSDVQRLAPLLGWVPGEYEFSSDQTPLVATVITPLPDTGVRSLRADDNELLYGDVLLVGGLGVTLDVDITEPSSPVIVVNATGEPLFKRVLCAELGFQVPCFLETINGNKPDDKGNFYIGVCGIDSSNTIIRVLPTETGLHIQTVGKTVV